MLKSRGHKVKRGTVREERLAGSQRRIVNQHITDIVNSFHTERYTKEEI
jgi:hypothetical protein